MIPFKVYRKLIILKNTVVLKQVNRDSIEFVNSVA